MDILNSMHEIKTRKQHRCYLCGNIINKGEICQSGTFVDDDIYTIRAHANCWNLAIDQDATDNDGCYTAEAFDWMLHSNLEYLVKDKSNLKNTQMLPTEDRINLVIQLLKESEK